MADLLTKSLPKKQFDLLVNKLVMKDIFNPARGGVWEKSVFLGSRILSDKIM